MNVKILGPQGFVPFTGNRKALISFCKFSIIR